MSYSLGVDIGTTFVAAALASIAVLANGRQAYVTNLDNGTVAVLDLTV